MHVRVRHFQSDHGDTDAVAGKSLLDAARDFLAKKLKTCQRIIVEIEDVVDFFFRDDKGVPHHQWIDIEECEIAIVLGHDVSGNLAVDYFGEEAGHGGVVSGEW